LKLVHGRKGARSLDLLQGWIRRRGIFAEAGGLTQRNDG
jgi:hypothetical protein